MARVLFRGRNSPWRLICCTRPMVRILLSQMKNQAGVLPPELLALSRSPTDVDTAAFAVDIEAHLPDPSPVPDRRQLSRFRGIGSPVTFTTAAGEVVVGRIRDITVLGIGIETDRNVAPDTTLAIHVPAYAGRPLTFLSAVAKHCAAQENGVWVLGCLLQRPLEIDEILALG